MRFSLINHLFWETPILGTPHLGIHFRYLSHPCSIYIHFANLFSSIQIIWSILQPFVQGLPTHASITLGVRLKNRRPRCSSILWRTFSLKSEPGRQGARIGVVRDHLMRWMNQLGGHDSTANVTRPNPY